MISIVDEQMFRIVNKKIRLQLNQNVFKDYLQNTFYYNLGLTQCLNTLICNC